LRTFLTQLTHQATQEKYAKNADDRSDATINSKRKDKSGVYSCDAFVALNRNYGFTAAAVVVKSGVLSGSLSKPGTT